MADSPSDLAAREDDKSFLLLANSIYNKGGNMFTNSLNGITDYARFFSSPAIQLTGSCAQPPFLVQFVS